IYSQAGADAKFLTEVDGGDPDAAPLPVTLRRGTTAEWTAANPVLAAGEPAVVLDSGLPAELVLGDGVTAMADLRAAVWDDDARLALADTATQPGDLGTAAAADVGDFATAAQGAKADAANAAVVPLPAATGTNDTTAIQAILTANPGKRIAGRPGSSYRISAPLVIASGTTLDMTGCTVTLIAGSNCRMIQNAALSGSGARDTDITIRGGYWDRGTNGGTTSNDQHSIVFHRADRVSVSDVRFSATGPCKYSIYLVDVNVASVARCDISSTSDGVHVTGPSSDITVRDITGTTDDDMVSFTGRDYPNYELTAGGGNITNVVVDNVNQNSVGATNAVKLLSGAAMTLSDVSVRNVTIGAAAGAAVSILSDPVQASTVGGTIRNVSIDGVRCGSTSAVDVAHPAVNGLSISNVAMTANTAGRAISFNQAGTTVTDVVIDKLSVVSGYTRPMIHFGSGATVTSLKVSNVNAPLAAGGYVLSSSGTTGHIQMQNITLSGGSLGYLDASSVHPVIAIDNLHITPPGGGLGYYGAVDIEVQLSNVTGVPTNGYLVDNYSMNSTTVMKAQNIVGTATNHIHKSGSNTPKTRAVGLSVRCDVSLLTPVSGDIVTNTNAALACGVGPVIFDGTLWKNLHTDAEDFATAEQGALADTAVQPADLTAYATDAELTAGLATKADASHSHATTGGGVRWVALGDSLTSLAGGGAPYMGWATQAEILSAGKIRAVANAGVSGDNAADALARLPALLAAQTPTLVTVWVGTNDVTQARTLAAYQSDVIAIVDALTAASVTVAILTIPPRNDLTKLNTINTWNRWLKTLCRDRNLHLIDAYDVLVDRTTGAYAVGHGDPDGVHISPLGHNKVGALFAATMVPRVIASSPLEPHTNSDTGNLLANGLLLTGSPLPTSWVATGGATTGFTESLVTDADFRGKAWEVAAVTPPSFRQLNQLAPSGWAVGDTLLFTARVKVVSSYGVPDTLGLSINCNLYGSSGVNPALRGANVPDLSGVVSKRLVVPAGTTDVQLDCVFNPTAAGTATYRVGELAIYNLTAQGLA
ncbi:MAG TPA: GDSL-type esterase/lipase family protein, partial [Nitrospira sp.]|nr:GDSL-type esterase/lipase family protein [Nitrospira sp.]